MAASIAFAFPDVTVGVAAVRLKVARIAGNVLRAYASFYNFLAPSRRIRLIWRLSREATTDVRKIGGIKQIWPVKEARTNRQADRRCPDPGRYR